MAFNPSEYANNGAGRDISQFVKIATQVSEYRNAEFVRDLNSKTLQLRLSNPGISDLKIAQFEDGEYAKLYSKRLGFRVQAPMPQTDFAQQQALRGTGKIQGQEAVAQYDAQTPMREQQRLEETEQFETEQDILQKGRIELQKAISRPGKIPFFWPLQPPRICIIVATDAISGFILMENVSGL